MSPLTIDSGGRVVLPHEVHEELGTSSFEVLSYSEGHLLLKASEEEGGALVFAGSLSELAVADLLSFANMFRKTGVLTFCLEGATKSVYFSQGEVVFATSSSAQEDLGEVLCSFGKVGREELYQIRSQASDGDPIGKVLVGKGLVSPKDLWLATRNQVEGIVYNLFACTRGAFHFYSKPLDSEEIVRLSMSTQNLIMEGARRADERSLFMRRIPSLGAIVVPGSREPKDLSSSEREMMDMVGEGFSVEELLRKAGHGEFEGLRVLYGLTEKRCVEFEDAPEPPGGGGLAEILTLYNGVLVKLYGLLSEKNEGVSEEIRSFIRELPPPFSFVFRDTDLLADGSVDGSRIFENLSGLGPADQKKLLSEGLGELLFMVFNIAKRDLGSEIMFQLLQMVQEVSSRVETLSGEADE